MRPIKFIHAAGLRLDSPYTGLRETNAAVDECLRSAPMEALDNLVALCRSEEPDFVLISGGVFDLPDRSVRSQLKFLDALSRIATAGVSVYIAFGPGDPAAAWLRTIDWPSGVHVMGGRPEWRTVTKDGSPIALVQGASHQSSALPGPTAADFLPAPDHDLFCIGLASHVTAEDGEGRDSHTVLPRMHYWAIGPEFENSMSADPSRRILSASFTQGMSPLETGAHGCYVVETDEAGRAGPRFVALDSVRFADLTVDVTEIEPDLLARNLRETVMGSLAEEDGRNLVVRVTLTGTAAECDNTESLLDQLRESLVFDRPWAWIDRIDNLAGPVVNDPDPGEEASPLLAALNLRYETITRDGALEELTGAAPSSFDTTDPALIARDARLLATRLLSRTENVL